MEQINIPMENGTDTQSLITDMEIFMLKYFKVRISIRKQFIIPRNLRGKNLIPLIDPGRIETDEMLRRLSRDLEIKVEKHISFKSFWDLRKPRKPQLTLVEGVNVPSLTSMGKPLHRLAQWTVPQMNPRQYIILFAFLFSKGYLLDETTTTVFPRYCQFDRKIWTLTACWNHKESRLEFDIRDIESARIDSTMGLRLAYPARRRHKKDVLRRLNHMRRIRRRLRKKTVKKKK
jgi:hypothetical protein